MVGEGVTWRPAGTRWPPGVPNGPGLLLLVFDCGHCPESVSLASSTMKGFAKLHDSHVARDQGLQSGPVMPIGKSL